VPTLTEELEMRRRSYLAQRTRVRAERERAARGGAAPEFVRSCAHGRRPARYRKRYVDYRYRL